MNTDKLKDFVNNSELNRIQKTSLIGFLTRAEESDDKNAEDRQLIIDVAYEKKVSNIVLSTEEVKIYTVSGKEDWDIKYPYRSIFKEPKSGKWMKSGTVSPTLDLAFIVYLENKYLGANSKFTDFAIKMLEIKID